MKREVLYPHLREETRSMIRIVSKHAIGLAREDFLALPQVEDDLKSHQDLTRVDQAILHRVCTKAYTKVKVGITYSSTASLFKC